MTNKISLYLAEGHKQALLKMAADLGYLRAGKPSIGAMISAIAKGELQVVKSKGENKG